jgi:HK97 family phage major capsid protein
MDFISKLREEFAATHAEAATVIETAGTEGRDLTADEKAANEKRFARLETIKNVIDDQMKFAKLALEKGEAITPKTAPGKAEYEANEGEQFAKADKIDKAEFSKALSQWALTGQMAPKFATITTATSSGALFPKQVAAPVVATQGSALREAMAAVGVSPIKTDGTADLNIPVIAVAVGSDVSETASSGTDNSPVPPVINLKPVPIQSGQAWVSNLELGSLDYDLLGEIVPGLADAKEMRLEQKAFAAMIADAGITQTVATATTTGFTFANLVDLNRKFNRRYDRLKVIVLSDAAYAAAEKLTGSDGHPVLNRDPQNQSLLRFNGTPVIRSSYLEAFGASKVVGVILSFVGVKVRDCGTQRIIRHVDDKDKVEQTGLNLVGYHAVGYTPEAVATLKTPVS